MSIISTTPQKPPIGACDGNGLTPNIKPPKGACDGGGFTAKANIPETVADTVDISSKKSSVAKKGIAAAVLLIGGAILGYGHRNIISKNIQRLSNATSEFFATGTAAKVKDGAVNLLAKAKDLIFAKSV